ncbi:MAG: hypothetical protein Q7J38_16645 [Gallionella sp.]|nr:hypothetical protein [Gallionella sp.]
MLVCVRQPHHTGGKGTPRHIASGAISATAYSWNSTLAASACSSVASSSG